MIRPGSCTSCIRTGARTDRFGAERQLQREGRMNRSSSTLLKFLHKDEAGQGLVEYALILVLLAFAAVVAMRTVANDINSVFVGIGMIVGSYVP